MVLSTRTLRRHVVTTEEGRAVEARPGLISLQGVVAAHKLAHVACSTRNDVATRERVVPER